MLLLGWIFPMKNEGLIYNGNLAMSGISKTKKVKMLCFPELSLGPFE